MPKEIKLWLQKNLHSRQNNRNFILAGGKEISSREAGQRVLTHLNSSSLI